MSARLGVAAAFLGALAAMAWLATHHVDRGGHLVAASPRVHSGDEPHYLLVINSLFLDGDLALGADYDEVRAGGLRAGERAQGRILDHHTILVDRARGESAVWSDLYDWKAPCRVAEGCSGFRRLGDRLNGPGVVEVPAHPAALPALAAAWARLTGAAPGEVEGRVLWLEVLCGWLAAVLVYAVVRRAGAARGPALAGAMLLLFASPWLLYSRSLFVEVPIGLALMVALWLHQRGRPAGAAAGVLVAIAFKPSWVMLGAGWVLERALARAWRDAAWMAGVLGAGGLGLLLWNRWLSGMWLIGGQESLRIIDQPYKLFATFLHPDQGLLAYVPWVIPAAVVAVRRRALPPLLRPILFALGAMLPVLMIFHSLGGYCYGPRYWVGLLPLFAAGAVLVLDGAPRWAVRSMGVLAGAAAALTLAASFVYRGTWDTPQGTALLLLARRLL